MPRRRRGRFTAPPPPPDGQIWDHDEFVSLDEYAKPHVREMQKHDALTPDERADARRTGLPAQYYLDKRPPKAWWEIWK